MRFRHELFEDRSAFGRPNRPARSNALVPAILGAMALLFASPTLHARDQVPSPGTPFAGIPSHLKTTTTTEQKPLRPLLIWQIGPGGSFADRDTMVIDGKKYREARWDLARRLLNVYTKKYGNKIQWALYIDTEDVSKTHVVDCMRKVWFQDVNKCAEDYPQLKTMFDYYQDKYGGNQRALYYHTTVKVNDSYIERGKNYNRATRVWGDYDIFMNRMNSKRPNRNLPFRPLSLNYTVQPVILLRENIRYRCQPAFYVVVDDGYQYAYNDSGMNRASENAVYGMFELATYGLNPYPWKKLQIRKYQEQWGEYVMNYDYACMTKYGKTDEARRSQKWFQTTPPDDGSCGMRFFSSTLANTDLMQEGNLPPGREKDDAGKSWDDPKFKKQSIETFAIRINMDKDNYYGSYAYHHIAPQSYFRMKGIASRNDYFYDVKDGEQFKNAFDSIISTVEKSISYGKVKAYSTVSPALGAPEMTPVPGSAANIRLNMFEGSSEIRFHEVEYTQDADKFKHLEDEHNLSELDEAATYDIKVKLDEYTLPKFDERTPLFEYDGSAYLMNGLASSGLDNEDFEIPSGSQFFRNEWRDSLLKWVTRTKADKAIHDNTNNQLLYRVRKNDDKFDNYNMGDIIDTPVLDIGDYMTTAANDGMVYVFKKTADNGKKFSLKMNYLPMDAVREDDDDRLIQHYHLLPDPEYAQTPERPHQYMINGGMTWRLTAESPKKSRNLIVAGSFGQGGRGAYAIRIAGNDLNSDSPVGIESNQNVWSQAVPLFTVNADDYDKLGYTFGDPQIGQVSNNRQIVKVPRNPGNPSDTRVKSATKFTSDEYRYAMFLSSGFNNPSEGIEKTESALYVFNVFDRTFGGDTARPTDDPGELMNKIVADKEGGGLAQSTLVDLDNDGIVDLAYAGDYNGTLYRFDFRNGIDRAGKVAIFKAPFGQHFTSAPGIMKVTKKDPNSKKTEETGEVMVVIGTGSDIYESDTQDKGQNAVYGIKDDPENPNPGKIDITKLQAQTFHSGGRTTDKRGETVETRIGSDHKNDKASGWYMNLSENTGERVVTKPVMYDGMALVTTRIYDSTVQNVSNQNDDEKDPCVTSEKTQKFTGSGWIMQFDAVTGSIPTEFDYKTNDRQAAYVDFLGNLENKNKPIVTGVMEPDAGIPNLTMSGDKPVAQNIQIMKGVDFTKQLQMDANFEGDIGGSGVSGKIRKLTDTQTTINNYNLHEMKYDRKKIVPALFISTSIKGLQDPYTLAIKRIPDPKNPKAPASQTQILKRISFKVLDI